MNDACCFCGLDFKIKKKTQYEQLLLHMPILNFIIILALDIGLFSQGMGDWIICYLMPRCGCGECLLACLQYTIMAWWLGIRTLYVLSHVTATVNISEPCAAHTLVLQRTT